MVTCLICKKELKLESSLKNHLYSDKCLKVTNDLYYECDIALQKYELALQKYEALRDFHSTLIEYRQENMINGKYPVENGTYRNC
tara:strand:- start:80 stop:334 length:255 start_codon:yes stop_codon:yes gene_type:complete